MLASLPSSASPLPSLQKKEGLPEIPKDLAVQELIVTPNEFSLGERINIVFDIHNLGPTHVAQVEYVVSIGGMTLYSGTFSNLSPGSINGVKREITIPQTLRPGKGVLGVRIVLQDDNRENNYTSQLVTIRQETLNLTLTRHRVINRQPGPLQAGSFFDVEFTILNTGQLETMPCKYKVKTERPLILSTWRVIDERSYDVHPLRPGEFMDVSPTFQIPEDLSAGADLRITIYVDSMNQIRESSEEDNDRVIKAHY